jgi:hypothetical protein
MTELFSNILFFIMCKICLKTIIDVLIPTFSSIGDPLRPLVLIIGEHVCV